MAVPLAPPGAAPRVRPDIGRWVCVAALALSGAVFVLKYAVRLPGVTEPVAALAAVAFALGYAALVGGLAAREPQAGDVRAAGLGATVLFVALAALALATSDATRVARLPAIQEWLGAFANGEFPYGTPQRPSGFPGLFLVVAPFWAAGGLWAVAPVGTALTGLLLRRPRALAVLAALALFPPTYYEAAVKSELVFCGALSVGAVGLAEWARRRGTWGPLGLAAVAAGVVLSTRLSAALVVAAYGVWVLRRAPRFAWRFGPPAAAVFALTVVPFYLWSPGRFVASGPLAVQGAYLPTAAKLAVVAATVAAGWSARSAERVLVRAGGVVWVAAATSFGLVVAEIGFRAALWGDGFDVAYFVLAVPLLLWGAVGPDSARSG